MSPKLLVVVPDALYERLTQLAEQRKQSVEEVAVDLLIRGSQRFADDPLDKWIGAIHTGMPDWADRHDELIGEALLDDHSSEEQ